MGSGPNRRMFGNIRGSQNRAAPGSRVELTQSPFGNVNRGGPGVVDPIVADPRIPPPGITGPVAGPGDLGRGPGLLDTPRIGTPGPSPGQGLFNQGLGGGSANSFADVLAQLQNRGGSLGGGGIQK